MPLVPAPRGSLSAAVLVLALALALVHAPAAPAAERRDPCRPKPPSGAPSAELLATLGVLRRPAAEADRPPAWIRRRRPAGYAGAARFVPLPVGGGVWVVPIPDVSGRVILSEACIRSLPRRWRARLRRENRRARQRRPVEGVELLPVGADGESRGGAGSPGAAGIRRSGIVHTDGGPDGRTTIVVGLVPDGVAQVRIVLPAHRDERGRQQPERSATVAVADNAYGAELPTPFDFEFVEPAITWLDASGAVVGPARQW